MPNQPIIVEAKQPWSRLVKKGQVLVIKDTHGQQAFDFLCYDAENTSDPYSAINTVKVQGNVYVGKGTVLYADSGKPLLSVIEDTFGKHGTIYGCCSNPNNNLVTMWKQPCLVIRTLTENFRRMAWMSPQLFQT